MAEDPSATGDPAPQTPDPMLDSSPLSRTMPADDAAGLGIDQASIDELLKQANFEDPGPAPAGGVAMAAAPAVETASFDLPNFQQVMQDAQVSSIDLLRDVDL